MENTKVQTIETDLLPKERVIDSKNTTLMFFRTVVPFEENKVSEADTVEFITNCKKIIQSECCDSIHSVLMIDLLENRKMLVFYFNSKISDKNKVTELTGLQIGSGSNKSKSKMLAEQMKTFTVSKTKKCMHCESRFKIEKMTFLANFKGEKWVCESCKWKLGIK